MLIDSKLDTTGYAITFPKPGTNSFYMCRGYAEFLTSYPREHEGEICDKVRLSFDGFNGFVMNLQGALEYKWISNVVVYICESPRVVAVINGIEYLMGVISRCKSHEELLESLEKLFNAVAVQNGGCLRGGA